MPNTYGFVSLPMKNGPLFIRPDDILRISPTGGDGAGNTMVWLREKTSYGETPSYYIVEGDPTVVAELLWGEDQRDAVIKKLTQENSNFVKMFEQTSKTEGELRNELQRYKEMNKNQAGAIIDLQEELRVEKKAKDHGSYWWNKHQDLTKHLDETNERAERFVKSHRYWQRRCIEAELELKHTKEKNEVLSKEITRLTESLNQNNNISHKLGEMNKLYQAALEENKRLERILTELKNSVVVIMN